MQFLIEVFTVVLLTLVFYDCGSVLILKEPYHRTGRELIRKVTKTEKSFDIWLKHPFWDIVSWVSTKSIIYIQSYEEIRLENDLRRLKIPYTARQYRARGICIMCAGVLGMFLCTAVMQFPLGGFTCLSAGFFFWFYNEKKIRKKVADKSEEIKGELPQFLRCLSANMKCDNDLIAILRRYLHISASGFRDEITILLTDLSTGNEETALLRFGQRVNMPEVSRLVSILINANRGEDQTNALYYLSEEIQSKSREKHHAELSVRPDKVRMSIIPCIIFVLLAILYAFGSLILKGFGNIL